MWALHTLLTILSLITYAQVVAGKVVSTTVRLGEVAYYLHPSSTQPTVQLSISRDDVAEPCTILTISDQLPNEETLRAIFDGFGANDDVWSPEFRQTILIQLTGDKQTLSQFEQTTLHQLGANHSYVFHTGIDNLAELPQGPYFLHHGHLYQAYRLYPDAAGAFIVATVPAGGSFFRPLDVAAYGEQFPSSLTVAVPSHLYYTPSEDKPYAGLRIAIKDIIDLKGLKTGASSRAYTELYPAKEDTAEAVQRLIDMGFVLPTCDWVDYHGPFNPRGDGYLRPSGSSAGSASAIASYQWLDFSLGTDTLGSIRSPSAAQGIFGMRPSLGAASTKGLVPYSSNWDTIGGFARTATEFKILAQALYGTGATKDRIYKRPTKLLYPTEYWTVKDPTSQEVFESFIQRLERFLGVRRTMISLADIWKETRPEGSAESISEYFHHAFDWSANRDQWTGLHKPFIDEYTTKTGKPPVLNPQVRFKVEYTPTVTAEQKAEGERLLKTYHEGFYKHVMPPAQDGSSRSIIVLPWTNGEPDYCDNYKDGPQQFTGQGFFFYNVGPYAQCPELIFPVGTTPYTSKFTGKTEQLPAAVGFIAAKGSDLMLADFVSSLFADRGLDLEEGLGQISLSNEL